MKSRESVATLKHGLRGNINFFIEVQRVPSYYSRSNRETGIKFIDGQTEEQRQERN